MNEQIRTIPFVRLRKKTYWYDRTVPGLGRLRMSLRVPSFPKANYMDVWVRAELLETLIRTRQFDLVEALKDGRLDWVKAITTQQHGDLADLTRDLRAAAGMELTLRDAVALLMDYAGSATDRQNTIRGYRYRTNKLLEEFGEDTPIRNLSVKTLQEWLQRPGSDGTNGEPVVVRGIGGGPWKPNTQNSYKDVFHLMWELAIDEEEARAEREKREPTFTRNPWKKVVTHKGRGRARALRAKDWNKIVRANEGTLELTAAGSGYLVGLRSKEARWLEYQDFRREDGEVYLIISAKEDATGNVFRPKSKLSDRDILVPRQFVEMIMVDGRLPESGWVFGTDGPMSYDDFTDLVHAAFDNAGVTYGRHAHRGYTHHSGRHGCATRMLETGVEVHVVARHIGDTVATVLRTYDHALPRAMGKLAKRGLEDV